MSSAASATSASSSAKKVEWYHLDKVAIAKRICLDPAAVKLKTALNNNNNNNNNNYSKHNNNTSSATSNASGKSGKSSGGGGGNLTGSNSSSGGNNNGTSTAPSKSSTSGKTSTPFDIVHLLYPSTATKSTKESTGASISSRVVPHPAGDPSKGIFALRYNPSSLNGSGGNSNPKNIPSYITSVAGSRQFAALQQKRRRKAQRLAAVAAAATVSTAVQEIKQQQQQQGSTKLTDDCEKLKAPEKRSSFLDEHGLIVSGVKSKSAGGSCGSSSRSSSSGVSSDFEELDGSNNGAGSDTNMKVVASSGSSSGSRQSGNQSSTSSECEDDDDEGPPPDDPIAKMCKNVNGSGSTGSSATASITSSSNGNINNNNNNLSNLSVLNSLVMGDGVVGESGKVAKSGRNIETSRIVSRKVALHNCSGSSNGNSKAMHTSLTQHHHHHHHLHHNHHHVAGTKSSKMEPTGTSTSSSRQKLPNGSSSSSHSMSSASSTVSGSTDNDRDTDNSFSEFPADLDFLGVADKGKRRTDRYDSSESSDSGVATLSPSTSDSPELIATCDFSSEPHSLDVGNLISASRSSSLSNTSSSYPPPSCKSSSCSSSASTCSGSSTGCFADSQSDPTKTGSSSSTTTAFATKPTLPTATSSTGSSDANLPAVNPPVEETRCLWKDCTCPTEAIHNILEHIQTMHVAPQMKSDGYVCKWENCKVYNAQSSSLKWLERHVVTHSGTKPFKCIFPGCGLSFSSQNQLERHVNSHIATNGTTNGTQGNSTVANKKFDASPSKSSKSKSRKNKRIRKQRINIGQRVDYVDKRIMEVIKHLVATSADRHIVSRHECSFRGEIIARRLYADSEPDVLVRWHPRLIFDDEWMPESKFSPLKMVPVRRIPSDKIRLIYPAFFPPERQGKASRKRKPRSNFNAPLSPSSSSVRSEGSSSLTTLPPSPNVSPSEIASIVDSSVALINATLGSSRNTRSSTSSSSSSSSASMCSFSSSASTSSTSSASSTQRSFLDLKDNSSPSTSLMMMMMDTSTEETLKSDIEPEDDKYRSSPCDCPSALLDVDGNGNFDESSQWALDELYEDMGFMS